MRTVAAMPNIESIPFMGQTFLDAGIDPTKMRWKIYQVSPIGPRKEHILNGDLLITENQFDKTIKSTRDMNPAFTIEVQPFKNSFGRYFHIFPDGKSHIVTQGKDELPEEIEMGNIAKNFDDVIEKVNKHFDFNRNSKHGSN